MSGNTRKSVITEIRQYGRGNLTTEKNYNKILPLFEFLPATITICHQSTSVAVSIVTSRLFWPVTDSRFNGTNGGVILQPGI